VNASLAARAIVAAQKTGFGDAALAEACLAAVWARDLDIADADVVVLLARECGLDGDALLARAQTPECEALYQNYTDEAIAAGVVGSPTVFVGDAMFFGQDRFDFVEEELAQAMLA
jgi:2-hydroxychromene-2-carboxylate isomerase